MVQNLSSINSSSEYPIIINQSMFVPGTNSYVYKFPFGSNDLKNAKIALSSIEIFYSWFNITAELKNNNFTLQWPTTGSGFIYYQVVIPDGFYSITTLNSWLQSFCITNGLYLKDSGGNNVYYQQFLANSSQYAIQLNLYEVPSSLPVGFTNPAGMSFPTVPTRPSITIGTESLFGDLIGFAQGTYNDPSTLSSIAPQMSPTQTVIVQCSLIDNKMGMPNSNLYAFSTGASSFGEIVSVQPSTPTFVDITDGSYYDFKVSFTNQNYFPLRFKDTNMLIQLIIKK